MMIKNMSITIALCLAMVFSTVNVSSAFAAEETFANQLTEIEERSKMLNLVLKKLTSTYKKAKKQHEFLASSGMPEEDMARLESAFKNKIKGMINDAITEIEKI